ncbi:MAG TPA: PfkB family carbohydrate kinase [Anaeromyxobacter sp.]
MDEESARPPLRIAVVGHVEHVTLGRVSAVPRAGEIVHVASPRWFPGGGGGVAFLQLARSDAEVHLFTALGDDEAGAQVAAALSHAGAGRSGRPRLHVVHRRGAPHTRCIAMIGPDGERTIVVVGEPHHPRGDDPLPWDVLARCDAAYFTADDPAALRAARFARVLVATARRRGVLAAARVRADVVVGSASDARERSRLAEYPTPPGALVLTEGAQGGRIETASGTARFPAPPPPPPGGGAYGAGDSFAAALTFYLAAGLPLADACARAGRHGVAVLAGLDPRETQLPLERP